MAQVAIRNVRKSFGAIEVLHGVSVDIADGEFVVLVGPSGCGKSTLLRMVAGLEKITAGEVAIEGHPINDLPPKDRNIAMVFQNYALYPHMTVAENMGFALRLAKVPAAEAAEKIRASAGILGLTDLLDRYPRQLSGGQRQRVAMGRAIVRNPKVFLFDEPLSNLDAALRMQMRVEIAELHQKLGTTMIYVTHDQVEAMTLADRIVVMQAGRVEQAGAPIELYDRPENTFVAQFIGSPSMNILPGRRKGSGIVLDNGGTVAASLPFTIDEGQGVLVGKRPENIRLTDAGGLSATVKVVEPTGSETYAVFDVGGEEVVGLFRDRVALREQEPVRLSFDDGPLHLFDAETKRRLPD